jgi:sigma-B regulation protein RsbU (phosphoserine phosphatase)
MGLVGFIYAKNNLIAQWQEAAVLRLERAARDVDMRLSRLEEWVDMYHKTGGEHQSGQVRPWILNQLEAIQGVDQVRLEIDDLSRASHSTSGGPQISEGSGKRMMARGGMMSWRRAGIAQITPPRYDAVFDHETVSIISELLDIRGGTVGRLEVVVRFDYLMENVGAAGWWQSNRAFLVDDTGKVLVCTDPTRRYLGDNQDPLEMAILVALQQHSSGTVIGEGHPPEEVGGYYKLEEVPWHLVLVAPGKEILAPIIRFRTYYLVSGILLVIFVVALIRWVTGRTVESIREVSSAADQISQGNLDVKLSVGSQDEVGQLTRSFNTMAFQLRERLRLKKAMIVAMEVQQNLLPGKPPQIEGLDITGHSIYCDETGGDYYDFLEFSELGRGRIGIVLGDVAGHGISAALLMTTARALLRSRITQAGSLAEIINDVNRLLCMDTYETGNFMSLFFMVLDVGKGELGWIRAGHDPALVYDPYKDAFDELAGSGIALGVDESWSFEEYRRTGWTEGQIILVGTDGIWETESPEGERFGKERLKQIIRSQYQGSSEEILQAVTESLADFRQTAPQNDDITLVVVKQSRNQFT